MSYEMFLQGPEVYIPIILISLVITVLAYGAFPFIYARTRKKTITKKQYNRRCHGFNLLVMFIFGILNGNISSCGPYFLWTWIFVGSGLKTLKNRGVLDGFQFRDDEPTNQIPSPQSTIPSIKEAPAHTHATNSSAECASPYSSIQQASKNHIEPNRKTKFSKGTSKKKNTTLRNFMASYPNGLGIHDAVALLLPVALQLRDMHNNGQPHLQVSPDTIMVGATAKLIAPTESEADRYISGFAAKEIYSGSGRGILSDIYSFCAVLYYASSGTIPANSLQRSTEDICTNENSTFAQIINKGMQMQPEDRFDTMQTVILRLSEYNVKPFIPKEEVHNIKSTTSKATRITHKDKVQIAISAIVVVIVVGYLGSYLAARSFAKKGEFNSADNILLVPAITKLHDKQLAVYIEAGTMMENQQYSTAKELFATIPGFLDADTMVHEADYRHAAQLADSNNFDAAIGKYQLLAAAKYKDSKEKVKEIKFRKGLYIFYEEHDYLKAYNYLSTSEYNDMNNISEIRNELKELLYSEAVKLYREGKIDQADTRFVEGYKDSDKYLLLIKVQQSYYGWWGLGGDAEKDVKKLIDFFDFEDTAEVLLSTDTLAEEFLRGNWKSATGGKYFKMDKEGGISYNLPWINYGDYYKIENGKLLLYPKNNENATRTMYTITALDPDQIQVYCHKDGSTHTLYRQ